MSKHVYALAAVIGAVAFAASMGWDALDPSRLDWIFLGGIDTSMQFLAWHMFRYEDWTWPLGATPSYGYPVGTSVALTDSIPVFALLFKALSPLLPPDFQYLGLWLLVCFVLHGVFGALLVRRCTASVTIQLLGAGLFVLSPLMIHRAAHAAPTAHWLLLASLWLYFDGKTGPIALVRWLGVVAFAAATHAYLTAMVLALAFAAVVRDGCGNHHTSSPALSFLRRGSLAQPSSSGGQLAT